MKTVLLDGTVVSGSLLGLSEARVVDFDESRWAELEVSPPPGFESGIWRRAGGPPASAIDELREAVLVFDSDSTAVAGYEHLVEEFEELGFESDSEAMMMAERSVTAYNDERAMFINQLGRRVYLLRVDFRGEIDQVQIERWATVVAGRLGRLPPPAP